MKKIILVFAIVFVSSSIALATSEYWNNLTHESKTAYVVGYRDGGNIIGLGATYEKKQKVMSENMSTIVSGIDKFYSDYANQKLPIPVAIAVVVSRLLGEPEEEIQKYIEEHRKEFNTP